MTGRVSGDGLGVLVVARWYPAYDDVGRGSFVADSVRLLVERGARVTVASFEFARLLSRTAGRDAIRATADREWSRAVARADACSVPRRWGAGVPVARLPVIYDPPVAPVDSVADHAAVLLPFGLALAERFPVDVVHAHTGVPDGLAAARLASELGVPLLSTEHDSLSPGRLAGDRQLAAAYRTLLDGDRRLVAVSRALATRLEEAAGLPSGAIDVEPNPVDTETFTIRADVQRDPDELLYVGSRKSNKGIETLLTAFASVHERRRSLRLRLIGKSPTDAIEDDWRSMARQLGIERCVSFEPGAGRADVAAAMARAGMFVHPSPWETFGVVAAEALASGLCVAATRSGGVEEVLGESGECGELASGTDAASLAAAILALHDRRATLSPEVMRERVVARYSSTVVGDSLYRRLNELAQRTEGPRPGGANAPDPPAPVTDEADGGDDPLLVTVHGGRIFGKLRSLPYPLRERLTVVTAVPPRADSPEAETSGLRLIVVDPRPAGRVETKRPVPWLERVRRRLVRMTRHPAPTRPVPRDVARADAVAGQVGELLRNGEGRRRMLVAADADDVAAIERLVSEGSASLAPGITRWLADRWESRSAEPDVAAPEREPSRV